MKSKNFQFSERKTGSFFHFTDDLFSNQMSAFADPSSNHILWNPTNKHIEFFCDDRIVTLPKSSFCTITALNFLKLKEKEPPLTCISFNREFYCLRDHDHEVSCNGILFYGAQSFPILLLSKEEENSLRKILDLFFREFDSKDPMQGEMLVSLLKVMIILLTRIGKSRIQKISGTYQEIEIIRKFNLLVDANFRKKKLVHDYAFLIGINPKKLSDVFRVAKLNPPLVTIHNRIILEAKRLLLFSLKSITEISDDLGFEDISQFTKLFKKYTNESPSQFRIGSRPDSETNRKKNKEKATNLNLKTQTVHNLKSLLNFLDQLSESEYSKHLLFLENKSISQHVRHVLEFYQELVLGSKKGKINYDARKRSLRVETDLYFTKEFLNLLIIEMSEIMDDREICIQVSSNIPGEMIDLQTTLFREISYCNEHTIHHMAILKLGIRKEFPELNLKEGFGVAIATLQYERSLQKF